MHLLRGLISLTVALFLVGANADKTKHDYQSDVARMRKIVINSLYSHKEIFLRELISNANDAIEKLRLTALKDKTVYDGTSPLNITIQAIKNEGKPGGKIVISDTGIGMTPEELTTNLGTLAKSGTSDFLAKAENQETNGMGSGNLIGAFGLGFYSSFLVADQVQVASLPPATPKNPHPIQHVFSSSSEESSFEIYTDPRGNTLGRGTEVTLHLKDDAYEYLEIQKLIELVNKHSSFSSAFPIYLFTQRTEKVPDDDAPETPLEGESATISDESQASLTETKMESDDDEVVVEDVLSSDEAKKETPPPRMKDIVVDEWVHLNSQPPLWMRDSKNITDEEYNLFYQSTFKDYTNPLGWHHFSAEAGSGTTFRAILYIPSMLEQSYWQNPLLTTSKDVRLMVKHVFITSDLGDSPLPKWANWVKVVIDADDLPLNVSRETLQNSRFLQQMKSIIVKRLIQLMTNIMKEDQDKFDELQSKFGTVLKLGAVEDEKNRDKLVKLTRFATNQKNSTSLDDYLANKKQGQKQIFYLAEMGKPVEDLAKSVFVEKLTARGYEVLLLNEPLDEIMTQNLRTWKNVPFQDVAKAGLQFGDEDPEEEKAQQEEMAEKYKSLIDWLKTQAKDTVQNVVISNRLVTSPVAIVASQFGYTANTEKLMSATNGKKAKDLMYDFAKKQKILEINPRSPLIEGLLRRIESLEEEDIESEDELKEVASILIDGALVRSGFEVADSNQFFTRVDRVLRRSLGVSENAPTDTTVKPAPAADPTLPEEEFINMQDHIQNPETSPMFENENFKITMEEVDDDNQPVEHEHDEL